MNSNPLRARIGWLLLPVLLGSLVSTGELAPQDPKPKRVVILGDSITAGYGVDPSEAYPTLLQQKVDAAGFPFLIVNAGVSGDTTSGGLRRLDWVLRQHVDVLIVALGGNDGLRGIAVELTRSNLQAIVDRAVSKYPGIRIVVAGMQMPPNLGTNYTDRFRAVFAEVARDRKAELVPFLLEGVGGKPELNQPDQIHPTPGGHEIVAETVWKVLKPVLEKRP